MPSHLFRTKPAQGLVAFLLAILFLAWWPRAEAAQVQAPRTSLRVVVDDDYPPYIFRAEDGTLQGILVDQWSLWEGRTGIHVQLDAMAWDRAMRTMGPHDVIDTLFFSAERQRLYEFGPAYARIPVPVFFHRDLEGIRGPRDLAGLLVGAKRGDNAVDLLRTQGVTDFLLFDGYRDLIRAARDGRVKAFVADEPPALYYLTRMGIQDQFRQSEPLYLGALHRAVRKGDSALLATIQGGFDAISRNEYKAIDQHWFGAPVLSRQDMHAVALVVAACAGLLLLLLLWVWTLRRTVRARTAQLTRSEAGLRRLNRELRAISICNQALMRSSGEAALLGDLCRIIHEEAGYRLVWVGFKDGPDGELRPTAWAGADEGFLQPIGQPGPDPDGRCQPPRDVLRTGTPLCLQDLATDPDAAGWREAALRRGYRSLICLPLKDQEGRTFGVLSIYSAEARVFSREEVRLLTDLSGDLAFGIRVLRTRLEQREAETALRQSEAENRAMISAIPDLVFTFSRAGEYLTVHATDPAQLYGSSEMLLHRNILDVLPAPIGERVLGVIRATLERNTTLEVDYELPIAGEDHYFEARLAPCTRETVIAIARDITEAKRSERRQRQLQAQLQQTQKMESLGSLAGGVAHDMNNVLGAIMALASVHIETQAPGSPVHRAFATILQAAERGGKMVQGLLNFARQSPAEQRTVDLNQLVREEIRLLERTTLAAVRLELDLDPALPPVIGDPSALARALMNLCVNALDAMERRGALTLRTRVLDRDRLEVQVQDTGCGMPPQVLDHALDPFFTTKPPGKGTGLGLAMVYSTVKAHHGQLLISSEPGQGTLVRMQFPAGRTGTPEPEAAGPVAAGAREELRVLLVDDDILILESMQEVLAGLGHPTTAVASGEEALRRLEDGLDVDVVIMDMNMPGLGGGGTLPRLRRLRPHLPVLIATGRVDQKVLDLVGTDPQVTLLAKPYRVQELQVQLEAVAAR